MDLTLVVALLLTLFWFGSFCVEMGFYAGESVFKLCSWGWPWILTVILNHPTQWQEEPQTTSRARTAWERDTSNPRPQMVRDGKCEPSRYLKSLLFNICSASCRLYRVFGELRPLMMNTYIHTSLETSPYNNRGTHSAAITELVSGGNIDCPGQCSPYSITHSFCPDRCWISHWTELGCVFILLNKDSTTF